MEWLESLADLLFPRHCKVCGRLLYGGERHLCLHCLNDIPLTYYWDWVENPAEIQMWGRTYCERVVPLFFYVRESDYSELLHRIKYKGDIKLARYLGEMLGGYLKGAVECDYIVPVPLHPRKKRKRGYNQSEEIAKGISIALFGSNERVVTNLLRRKHYTKTQTKIDVGHRWDNVKEAFEINLSSADGLQGKSLLLVDDVMTTGATLEGCWNELRKVKEIKVSVATLGYVNR